MAATPSFDLEIADQLPWYGQTLGTALLQVAVDLLGGIVEYSPRSPGHRYDVISVFCARD